MHSIILWFQNGFMLDIKSTKQRLNDRQCLVADSSNEHGSKDTWNLQKPFICRDYHVEMVLHIILILCLVDFISNIKPFWNLKMIDWWSILEYKINNNKMIQYNSNNNGRKEKIKTHVSLK